MLTSTNTLTIAAIPATLTLIGTPVASADGNAFSVTLDAPNAAAPIGTVSIFDNVGGQCSTTSWTNEGSDQGDEYYTAECEIETAESGGDTVLALYSGTDYTTVASNELMIRQEAATLTLIGAPVASATGNEFSVALGAPAAVVPTGTVTITDNVGGECSSASWTNAGFLDGRGDCEATCHIATAEFHTDTVQKMAT